MIGWVALFLLLAVPARAADLIVLSAGAIRSVAEAVTPGFEAGTGDKVVLRADTAGGLLRRIQAGEAFDVVLTSPAVLHELAKAGKIVPASRIELARVGVGVGIGNGVAAPDISTVAAFRAAMLGARKVAMIDPASGGSSGVYLTSLFQGLGIADAMAPKLLLFNGGLAGAAVADGRADIALQQISEILAVPGITLVGPLPPEIQNWTVYAGAIAAGSSNADRSRAFIAAVAAPDVRPLLAARGMMPP